MSAGLWAEVLDELQLGNDLRGVRVRVYGGAMTETAIATPTFYVLVGKTDAEFEIHMDREWGDDGPYFYEYVALPYEAEVKVLRESEGVAESYAQAIALANLVVRTAPAKSVVLLTVSDGTGQNFCCTGWESREDALATLARLGE